MNLFEEKDKVHTWIEEGDEYVTQSNFNDSNSVQIFGWYHIEGRNECTVAIWRKSPPERQRVEPYCITKALAELAKLNP